MKEDLIDKMIKEVCRFCPNGICPHCRFDNLKGIVITEKTEAITSCKKCKRSYVD